MRFMAIAALLVAFGAAAPVRADDPDTARKDGNWFTRLFTKAEPKKEEPPKSTAAPRVAAESQSIAAMTTLLRRQRVCDKLREIALELGDESLKRQADQLEQRAFEAYREHLSQLAQAREALDPNLQYLDSRLGAGAGTDARSSGASRRGAGATARRFEP